MQDIAPDLLKKILDDFHDGMKKNSVIEKFHELSESGKANYEEANKAAQEIGKILSSAYANNLSGDILPGGKMYYNIAERVIGESMKEDYAVIADIAEAAQTNLNKKAKIGLKAIKPSMNQDRVDGIINRISNEEYFDDIKWILDAPIQTFSKSIIDDSIKENAEFQSKVGLRPKIIRKSTGFCCKWCQEIAGSYTYPDVPDDVYRRHNNCNCTVEFDPGTGKKHQDVWSKQWKYEKEFDKIRQRKELELTGKNGVIKKRINKGEYSIKLSKQQYLKHVEGTKQFEQYADGRKQNGQDPQGCLYVSEKEAQKLIEQYAGTGTPHVTDGGSIRNVEFVTADHIIGKYYKKDGSWIDTKRFAIHYGKKQSHIVPVKEDYSD